MAKLPCSAMNPPLLRQRVAGARDRDEAGEVGDGRALAPLHDMVHGVGARDEAQLHVIGVMRAQLA